MSKLNRLAAAILVSVASMSCLLASPAVHPLTPDAELGLLRDGNARFVSGHMRHKDYSYRVALTAGQQPYACFLSCADSRVPPELVFDEDLGKLFVCRVAGNVVDPAVLGSLEYGVEHLHANLIVVMGHEKCGAVKAALAGGTAPRNLDAVLGRIEPAAKHVQSLKLSSDAAVHAAVEENVRLQIKVLLSDSPILKSLLDAKKIKVVGALYDLSSGRVQFLGDTKVK